MVLVARGPRSGSAPGARRGPPPYPAPLPPESPDSFGLVTYGNTRTRLGSGSRPLTAPDIRGHLAEPPLPTYLPRPGSCSGSRAVGNLWSVLPVSGVSCSVLEVSGVSCSFLGEKSLGAAGVVGSIPKNRGRTLRRFPLRVSAYCSHGRKRLRSLLLGGSEGFPVSRWGRAVLGRTLRRVLVYTSLEVLYG